MGREPPLDVVVQLSGSGRRLGREGLAVPAQVDNKGSNDAWDAELRHRDMVIQKGHTYAVRFKAWSTEPTKVRPKLRDVRTALRRSDWADGIELTIPSRRPSPVRLQDDRRTTMLQRSSRFIWAATSRSPSKPFSSVCIDDVVVSDPEFTPPKIVHAAPLRKRSASTRSAYFPLAHQAGDYLELVDDASRLAARLG